MSALVARRTLTLSSKVGSEKVELQQLNGLQLFDYQAALLSVDWPKVEEKASQREQQKTLLAIHRITYELNLLLAWSYVAIRVAHSLWQATVNVISVRFGLFMAGSLVLVALAVRAALTVFQG